MEKIRIITDSASDLVAPVPEGITVLPMTIRFGDTEYQDGVTITHHEFYEKLIESDELPVTSLISPGAFSVAYQTAVDAGETVIVITISSKLSGTWQSAVLAAENFPGQVYVVDSLNCTIGQQVLVKYACQLVRQGLGAHEVLDQLEEAKHKLHILGLLNTLEYLKKGGRISPTVAFVGGVLDIKPVVTIQDGEVVMLGKARGSRNSSNYLMREIEKTNGVDFSRPVCLGYTGLSDHILQKYIQDSRSIWDGYEAHLDICSIGATIGTHIGPNAIAVAFFTK